MFKLGFPAALTAGLLVASSALANTVTLTGDQLDAGTENAAFTQVVVTTPELGLTAIASNGGVIRTYTETGASGLYVGAITDAVLNNTNFQNSTTAPTDGTYTLAFDRAVTSLSLTLDFITNRQPMPEVISEFMVDGAAFDLVAGDYVGANTSLDAVSDQITSSTGRGTGVLTISGAAFSELSFRHQQSARNIGFTIINIDAELAPIPLPAALPLLLAAIGGLGLLGRRRA